MILEACVECWANAVDGVTECGHTEGVHRWEVTKARLVVKHPAIPPPLAGEFSLPVAWFDMLRFMARHRRALRRVMAVNPREEGTVWWCEYDIAPPEDLLASLAPDPS